MKNTAILLGITLLSLGCSGPKSIQEFKSTTSAVLLPKTVKNVKIYQQPNQQSLGPCEPSIAIDPTNPHFIVAGSIIDNVHFSDDGGQHWNTEKLNSSLGVWGDPVIAADSKGNFYYFHLSDPDKTNWSSPRILDRIVCQKSTDKGKTWSDGVGIGLNIPKQQDKPLVHINPKNDHIYVTWTEFDKYGSPLLEHKSRILFSKSTDYGASFSAPVQLNKREGDCLDDDFTTEGVMLVSNEKNLYATWCFDHHIYFSTSIDEGQTWSDPKVVHNQKAGWSITVPGVSRANGFPVLARDYTKTKHRGTLYLNWADQDDAGVTSVYLSSSTTNGNTWSTPMALPKANPKAHQFFSWMSVSPQSGAIYIIYYETNPTDDTLIDVKLATSINGGTSFQAQVISESPFDPRGTNFFGDYNYIDVKNGTIKPIWTRVDDGLLSIWTTM